MAPAPSDGAAAWRGAPRIRRGHDYEDFGPNQSFEHHWGRTMTETDNVLFTTLTLHFNPVYFNVEAARAAGFERIPINPLLILGTAVSLSVEDLSERSEAFLGIDDVSFHKPMYSGETLYARSVVLEKRESKSRPGHGVVSWQTEGRDQRGDAVLSFKRANLFRVDPTDELQLGQPASAAGQGEAGEPGSAEHGAAASEEGEGEVTVQGSLTLEDLIPGRRMRHGRGKTVTEMDNVLLSNLMLNTADGHFDQHSASQSAYGERLVFGGIIAGLVIGLTTAETGESVRRELGLDKMRFLKPVFHGDTLYAASEVLDAANSAGAETGEVTLHHWGINQREELVFECDRRVLVAKRAKS